MTTKNMGPITERFYDAANGNMRTVRIDVDTLGRLLDSCWDIELRDALTEIVEERIKEQHENPQ